MINPLQLEESYRVFSQNLNKWAHDGIIAVDIALLNQLGLLSSAEMDHYDASHQLSHYFHVIEAPEKVTLFNERFVVWIVPKSLENSTETMTLIALLQHEEPHLEVVFSTSGVYNTPRHILKVLQHFLDEVIDTETVIASIDKHKST